MSKDEQKQTPFPHYLDVVARLETCRQLAALQGLWKTYRAIGNVINTLGWEVADKRFQIAASPTSKDGVTKARKAAKPSATIGTAK